MNQHGTKNRAAVLWLLQKHGPDLDRYELADRLHICPSTTRRILEQLVKEGEAHISGYAVNSVNNMPRALFSAGPTPPDLCLVKPTPTGRRPAEESAPKEPGPRFGHLDALFGRWPNPIHQPETLTQ